VSGRVDVEPYQWFLLGMMVAWTPSMIVLAVMLTRSADHSADCSGSREGISDKGRRAAANHHG